MITIKSISLFLENLSQIYRRFFRFGQRYRLGRFLFDQRILLDVDERISSRIEPDRTINRMDHVSGTEMIRTNPGPGMKKIVKDRLMMSMNKTYLSNDVYEQDVLKVRLSVFFKDD